MLVDGLCQFIVGLCSLKLADLSPDEDTEPKQAIGFCIDDNGDLEEEED